MSKLGKNFLIVASAQIINAPAAPPNDWLSYARFLYPFAISVGAVLAVIMLIIAGLQMMTASEGQRTVAKERIQNALLGLLLLVGVFIILKTINPALLNLQIDTSGLRVDIQAGQNNTNTGNANSNTNQNSSSNNPNLNVGDSLPNGTCVGDPSSVCGGSLPNGCIVGKIGPSGRDCTVTNQYSCETTGIFSANTCTQKGGESVPAGNCTGGCTGGNFCCASKLVR